MNFAGIPEVRCRLITECFIPVTESATKIMNLLGKNQSQLPCMKFMEYTNSIIKKPKASHYVYAHNDKLLTNVHHIPTTLPQVCR